MWVETYYGLPIPVGGVYQYFMQFFTEGYDGFYAGDLPPVNYQSGVTVGFVNLKTGMMELKDFYPSVSIVDEILELADQANQ